MKHVPMVNRVREKQKKGDRKMGKYTRKSKVMGEVAVMEVSPAAAQSSLGVRTRAKTLALQKSSAAAAAVIGGDDGSYLQLRSRRLVKPTPPIVTEPKRQKQPVKDKEVKSIKGKVGPQSDGNSAKEEKERSVFQGNEGIGGAEENNPKDEKNGGDEDGGNGGDQEVEASFGENVMEFDDKERATRESTPCSLIRDPNTIRTPGSSNRPTTRNGENSRAENPMLRHIPTANEMDEFFSGEEKQQQSKFIEKYNFDLVNDKPLSGRYEWVKLKP